MAPVKTAAGLAELGHRTHGPSRRHRTVLQLVDLLSLPAREAAKG